MKEIYCQILGNRKYCVFESEKDDRKSYSIGIDSSIVNDFTSVKEKAIEFIEILIFNAVSPLHIYDVSQDYLC
jgi:hypothetical protein